MSHKPSSHDVQPTSSGDDHPAPTPAPGLRAGWHRPEHMELPRPTYWPAVMAFGILLLAWGLVTTLLISGVGLVLFALALAGWIGALRYDH